MKYFFDTEFIEDGYTIDLLSIGIATESAGDQYEPRKLYLQNSRCEFKKASDWVWRNVFPHLSHFSLRGVRECCPQQINGLGDTKTPCVDPVCPWRSRSEIRDAVREFCDPGKYGKPEFWGYYADYDWVALCQLFGPMIALPKGYPMYCRDIKQWCDALGNPRLPEQGKNEHNALSDALWNYSAWKFLDQLNKAQNSAMITCPL